MRAPHTHSHSASGTARPGALLTALLALAVLHSTASAQLLFPANADQLRFGSAGAAEAEAAGPGELWWTANKRPPKVAIIGAGAGGSSAAYFLSHFASLPDLGLDSEVTIYESSDYIGGRSTPIWPWEDDPLHGPDDDDDDDAGGASSEGPVELGASLYVPANKNLRKAAAVFGLEEVEHGAERGGDDGEGMAIWDGARFVFTERSGWWSIAKMFWRYGPAPLKVQKLVKSTVQSFLELYSPEFATFGPFASWAQMMVAAGNLTHPASLTGTDFFKSKDVAELFTNELTAAATAVNYMSPVHRIHGLGALVSLATSGAVAVKGGNRQLFEQFAVRSGAKIRLGPTAKVTDITKVEPSTSGARAKGKRAQWVLKTAQGQDAYDAVILAAPFHQTGIKLHNTFAMVPKQSYVKIYVTFVLTTAAHPLPGYFGVPATTKMPRSIYATFDTDSPTPPTFNSLSYLKTLSEKTSRRLTERYGNGKDGEDEDDADGEPEAVEWHVVKLFSNRTLGMDELEAMFGAGQVGKVVEKEWLSYPHLDPVVLEQDIADVRLDGGLIYLNGFERFISTMETATVAAFNGVGLLLRDLFGYESPASWAEWDGPDVEVYAQEEQEEE